MTLVAVWKAAYDCLMAIADTRISREAENVLTEHGPKLLPTAIVCRQPGASGFSNKEVYRADIGFAYSGSTLSALATHALANTMLSNLVSSPGTPPPSIEEVALAIGGVSADYMREVGQLSGSDGLFKAIVFGYCAHQSKLRVFTLTPDVSSRTLVVHVDEHQLATIEIGGTAAASTVVIGTAPELLTDAIDAYLAAAKARIVAFNAPKRVLQKLIDEGANEAVGGSVQQAQATEFGFQIMSTAAPITPRPPSTRNTGLFVLGHDIDDMQYIGSHRVSLRGR
jgi:hypothetical protein